jgi:hypothetical protein
MVERLKPAEFLHLVNASPEFGSVMTAYRVQRLRENGGGQVSDDGGKTVRLDWALAWVFGQRLDVVEKQDAYEAKQEAARVRQRAVTRASQEIEIVECANPKLRDSLKFDLEKFCTTVSPKKFYRAFSDDHRSVIKKAERAILESGLYAVAMPRGGGKTRICDAAAMWSLLFGHRRFLVFFGADEDAAKRRLRGIKRELEDNELLRQLFPEICGVLQELNGEKRKTLRYQGERIIYDYSAKYVMLPHIPGIPQERAPGMGGMLVAEGLTASFRGLDETLPTGEAARPDLVILDDPQTAESAKSVMQTAERMRIINGDVLGLAGPDKTICGIMPCTVIRPGDLADQILTEGKCPEWDKSRCKLVYKWPNRADLWETEYRSLLTEGEGDSITRQKRATAYVRHNYDVLHAGAEVAWDERYDRGKQVSALQYAYDWRFRDEEAFNAEAQQAPQEDVKASGKLTETDIVKKLNNRDRGEIPTETHKLTAFVDVSQDVLFYAVVAWGHDFTGYVVDVGTYPDQRSGWFLKSDIRFTLDKAEPGIAGLEDAIYRGLGALVDGLASKEWPIGGGATKMIDRVLIDANWPRSTQSVYLFCKQSPHRAILYPSHGKYVGPEARPFSQYKRTAFDTPGKEWLIRRDLNRRDVPYVLIDTNFWKSFLLERFRAGFGLPGSLSVFGDASTDHRLLLSHLTAEAYETDETKAKGRRIDKWSMRVGRTENDWFDCLVGAAVGASIEGCSIHAQQEAASSDDAKARWAAFLNRGQ